MGDSKPFAPTQSRLQRARREGDVPRAGELVAVASFGAAFAVVVGGMPYVAAAMRLALEDAAHGALDWRPYAVAGAWALGTVFAAAAAAALVATTLAGGLTVTGLKLNLARLDPAAGLRRMLSRDAALGALRAAVAACAVTAALVPAVRAVFRVAVARPTSEGLAALALEGVERAASAALVAGLAFGVADALFERIKWRRRLRMTFDEMKRDVKQNEGDPVLRGRRRARHRELAQRSLARLREAAFVVANPTHVAVGARLPAARDRRSARRRPRARRRRTDRPRASARTADPGRAARHPRAQALRVERRGRVHCPRLLPRGRADRRPTAARGRPRMSGKAATYGFAAVVLAIVAMLVIPLPPALLDGLLALNIIGSGVVLLLSITIGDPLEFAAFAPALLVATLFRLALNVSATRLILTQGHIDGGVGSIIPAFGALVVGGNLVVGIIVFAILITIQFIVISSGSQRVAEVAARFTLDAMPGKQMAIDADLHAGAIDAEGARRKRLMIQKEADFYGAMDGAGKFVKGDAIAALIIVALEPGRRDRRRSRLPRDGRRSRRSTCSRCCRSATLWSRRCRRSSCRPRWG